MTLPPLDPGALATGGYAAVLLAAGAGIDRLSRHAQERSDRYRTAGFRYHPEHDAWTCPQDQMLWPQEFDAERRLMRYRAKPSLCNACPVKHDCTTSAHGREIVRAVDPWPHSEAGRFHRGIAVTVVAAAAALCLAYAAIARPGPGSLLVLAVPLLGALALGVRLTTHLRDRPSGFPEPTSGHGLRVTRAARTRWGSSAAPGRWGAWGDAGRERRPGWRAGTPRR